MWYKSCKHGQQRNLRKIILRTKAKLVLDIMGLFALLRKHNIDRKRSMMQELEGMSSVRIKTGCKCVWHQ
jgi:hypothetical protein